MVVPEEDPFLLEEQQFARLANKRPGTQIAVLVPLSGRHEAVGRSLQAANIALFDMRNPNITLLPIDTEGTPTGAADAARRAVSEGADLILGPLCPQASALWHRSPEMAGFQP